MKCPAVSSKNLIPLRRYSDFEIDFTELSIVLHIAPDRFHGLPNRFHVAIDSFYVDFNSFRMVIMLIEAVYIPPSLVDETLTLKTFLRDSIIIRGEIYYFI